MTTVEYLLGINKINKHNDIVTLHYEATPLEVA